MPASFDRRAFLAATPAIALLPGASVHARHDESTGVSFPFQDRKLVREIVAASHGSLGRVKELVSARPALARASWDWGFGDHESAIDAASHVGNRPIAEFLIANGARPTIFTAAMLGQVAVVRGMIAALPGVQRTRGPHGITLLAHARAGGTAAADVKKYLEQLGDADPVYRNVPVPDDALAALPGEYAFGAHGRFVVATTAAGHITIESPGVMIVRTLRHQGGLAFHPPGAETTKVRFDVRGAADVTLEVTDGPVVVSGRKSRG